MITEELEHGVRYPNGLEEWDTQRYFGSLESPYMRETFQQQYDLRMRALGAPSGELVFLTRVRRCELSDPEVIDNPFEMVDLDHNDHTNEELDYGTEPGSSNPELREPAGDSDPAERDAGSGERTAEG